MAVAHDGAITNIPERLHEGRRRVACRLAPVDQTLALQDHCWGRADRRQRRSPRVLLPQDRVERVAVAQSLRAGHAAWQGDEIKFIVAERSVTSASATILSPRLIVHVVVASTDATVTSAPARTRVSVMQLVSISFRAVRDRHQDAFYGSSARRGSRTQCHATQRRSCSSPA